MSVTGGETGEETFMADHATAVGKTFPWHELYVPDSDAAKAFYSELIGFAAEDFDMGEMGSYPMLSMHGTGVAGIMRTAGNPEMENVPAHWAIYMAVDDVDATVAKCNSLGGGVLVPPMDVPTVGRMALLRDPQGATFWVYKAASQ